MTLKSFFLKIPIMGFFSVHPPLPLSPFPIPQKDNCDLCRIKTNKRKATENRFLDQLFKFLYRDRFDFVFD